MKNLTKIAARIAPAWQSVDFQICPARLAFSFASFSFGHAKENEGLSQIPCE